MVHISWGTSLSIMCSPETRLPSVAMDAFPMMKIKAPHLKPGEEHKEMWNFRWEILQLSKRSNEFHGGCSSGTCRIRWMRSSRNAWAAAKIGCRDLKKSRKAEKPRGQESMPSSTAQRVFSCPLFRVDFSDWLQGGVQQLCDSNFNAHRWQRPFRGLPLWPVKSLPLLCQVTAEANLRNSPCVRSKNCWHELHAWKSSFNPFRMYNIVEF